MSNLTFDLVSLAWLPTSFDLRIDPQGAAWQLDKLDSPKGIIKQLVLSYDSQQCESASKHTNGKGMENGVDWNITLCYLNSQTFKGKRICFQMCT